MRVDGYAAGVRVEQLITLDFSSRLVIDGARDALVAPAFREQAIHSVPAVERCPFLEGVRAVLPMAPIGESEFFLSHAAIESRFRGIRKSPLDNRSDNSETEVSDFHGTGIDLWC